MTYTVGTSGSFPRSIAARVWSWKHTLIQCSV